MFFFLQFILCEYEPRWSLNPPYDSVLTEHGNWSFMGTVVSRKEYLMLTSHNVMGSSAIYQRIPLPFNDWHATMLLEIKGKGSGGNGFIIYFSDQFCPEFNVNWTGYYFRIDTSYTTEDGESPIYFANISTPFETPSEERFTTVRIKNTGKFYLEIKRELNDIYLYFDSNLVGFRYIDNILKGGYFSIVGMGSTESDEHDFYSFNLTSLSGQMISEEGLNVSHHNLKVINRNLAHRRLLKTARRKNMPISRNYFHDSQSQKHVLNGTQTDLSDALKIIIESDERAKAVATIAYLSNYIQKVLNEMTQSAERRTNNAFNEFVDIKQSVDEMWSDLKMYLSNLGFEARSEMQKLEMESIDIAKGMKLKLVDMKNVTDILSEEEMKHESLIMNVLKTIMALEVVSYLFFFIYKRTITSDFKKID